MAVNLTATSDQPKPPEVLSAVGDDGDREDPETLTGRLVCNLTALEGVRHLVGDLDLNGCNVVSADFSSVASLVTVEGRILIYLVNHATRASSPFNASFPLLRAVGGDLIVRGNAQLEAVALPALERVGGQIFAGYNRALKLLSVDSLDWVAGTVRIEGNPALRCLSMNRLYGVGGTGGIEGLVAIQENPSLASLSLGSLSNVWGPVAIQRNPSLASLSLGSLRNAHNLLLKNNRALQAVNLTTLSQVEGSFVLKERGLTDEASLSLEALSTVGKDFEVSDVVVDSLSANLLSSVGRNLMIVNNGIRTVSMDSLSSIGEALEITHNSGGANPLQSLSFPDLSSVGRSLTVATHKSLEALSMPAIKEVGGDLRIYSNSFLTALVVGTCPQGNRNATGCATDPLPLTVGGAVDIQRVEETGPVSSVIALLEAYGEVGTATET